MDFERLPHEAGRTPLAAPSVVVREVTADSALMIHALTQEAYAEYEATTPSSALVETAREVAGSMRAGRVRAAMGQLRDSGVGVACVRFRVATGMLEFFRLAVVPSARGRGVASELLRWLEATAQREGAEALACSVRMRVGRNRRLYTRRGFRQVAERTDDRARRLFAPGWATGEDSRRAGWAGRTLLAATASVARRGGRTEPRKYCAAARQHPGRLPSPPCPFTGSGTGVRLAHARRARDGRTRHLGRGALRPAAELDRRRALGHARRCTGTPTPPDGRSARQGGIRSATEVRHGTP